MLHQPLRRPGVVTLATAAFSQTADLLQTEFRLAKAEFAEKMTALRAGLIMILVGAIFLIAALGMLLQALADTVAPDSPAIADYVRGAGQKIDRLASDLRDKKVGDLLASAAEFGRSQPVIMLAGAALIGFALSRVVKAGVATPAVAAPSDNVSYVARREVY